MFMYVTTIVIEKYAALCFHQFRQPPGENVRDSVCRGLKNHFWRVNRCTHLDGQQVHTNKLDVQCILADQSLYYNKGSGEMWIRDFVTYVRLVHFQCWTRSEHHFCKTSSEKPFQGFCTSRADKGRCRKLFVEMGGGKQQPHVVTSDAPYKLRVLALKAV